MGSLDEKTVSLFLFGDAYQKNCNEKAGAVFALFNCSVCKENAENGFSLSVYSASHILKIGTSADYGVCKGKRKDGMACTLVINKKRGTYCSYHKQRTSEKYSSTTRAELKGGNLRTGFRDNLKSEGIYMVKPLADKTNFTKSAAPLKLLSVDGLKKALSKARKVTTNVHSQGIRFSQMTGNLSSSNTKESITDQDQTKNRTNERSSSTKRKNLSETRPSHSFEHKKPKMGQQQQNSGQKPVQVKEKMIELDLVSSDDEL